MIPCTALQWFLVLGLPAQAADIDPLLNHDSAPWVPPHDPSGVSAPMTLKARVAVTGTELQYAALFLDGDGEDQAYIKVQHSDSSGQFSKVGFYRGEGAGGWPGMTGGPALFLLPASFRSAQMQVGHDGFGNFKLTFSNLDPPGPDQVHQRGGWVPRNGSEFGIAGFQGVSAIDDFTYTEAGICDRFNRPDGPLGDDWVLRAGEGGEIRDGRAFIGRDYRIRGRFAYVGQCASPKVCLYALKKSKPKFGCLKCPPLHEAFESQAACDDLEDCSGRYRALIPCRNGPGSCRVRGKRSGCD